MTYRDLLKSELQKRVTQRSGYSLRAFARDLELDPGFLSHVLSGRRNLSLSRAANVSHKLKLTQTKRELFEALVRWENQPSDESRQHLESILSKSRSMKDRSQMMTLETATTISDWYHNAILELPRNPSRKMNSRTIARTFGISMLNAKLALERLVRLGLMKFNGHEYEKTNHHLSAPDEVKNTALRQRHRQILDLASKALNEQSLETRDYQAVTMNIDPTRIPEAKKRIRQFMFEICEYLEGGDPQEVYELSLQLFSLEKNRKNQ